MLKALATLFNRVNPFQNSSGTVDKEGVRTRSCKECGTKIEYKEHMKYCPGCSIFNFFRG